MNFQERVNYIFIKAHRELDEKLSSRKWVDVPFVHEFIDSLKDILYKYGIEYDEYLQNREETKRRLSGAKDVPSDAKASLEAQKIRIQANKFRALNGEQ